MARTIRLKILWLTLIMICFSTNVYAGELDGLGDLIRDVLLGLGTFFFVTIFLLWFFRKNHKFVLFTLLNLLVFFFLVIVIFFGALSDLEAGGPVFLFFLAAQVLLQIGMIIKAFYDKYQSQ